MLVTGRPQCSLQHPHHRGPLAAGAVLLVTMLLSSPCPTPLPPPSHVVCVQQSSQNGIFSVRSRHSQLRTFGVPHAPKVEGKIAPSQWPWDTCGFSLQVSPRLVC